MAREKLSLSPRRVMQAVDRFLFLWLSRILVTALATLVYPLARLSEPRTSVARKGPHLMIGAGKKGWELIEYKEIFASASEYLGSGSVSQLAFSGERPMLAEFHEALREVRPSHYYFDPRSGSQKPLGAAWEAFVIGFLVERYRVAPICVVADFPEKRWRLQTASVSASHGVVVSYMASEIVRPRFPHPRITGPMPFPLSVGTLRRLQELRDTTDSKWAHLREKAVFVGMLYEPRKTVIEGIQRGLAQHGVPMEIIGRMPDGARIPSSDYWSILCNARLIVSTSSQVAGKDSEYSNRNHFVYRFVEVTAAGTALAIEPVELSRHILTADIDYLAYSSVEEAVEKIHSAWSQQGRISRFAKNGAARMASLIETQYYWKTLFAFIGGDFRKP